MRELKTTRRATGVASRQLRQSELRKRLATLTRVEEERHDAAFLESLIENSPDCIKVLDLDTRLLSVNKGGLKLLEIDDVNPFLGRSWLEFWTGKDREQAEAAVAEAKAGRVGRFEALSPTPKGTSRWWDIIVSPLLDLDGRPYGLLAVSRDITNQKRAEEQLAEQRQFYQTILSNTPDFVYVFDLNHRFIYANASLLTMWGKTWDQAIGKNCLELGYEPWHAAMHDREIDQVITTKKAIRGEVPFTGTHGRRIYDYIFAPLFGEDGNVKAIAGTSRDITDIKGQEANLAFLADVSAAFAPLASTEQIMQMAGEKIFNYFGVSRLVFADVNEAADTVNVVYGKRQNGLKVDLGEHQLDKYLNDSFRAQLKSGNIVATNDVQTDPLTRSRSASYGQWKIRSMVHAPFVSDGRWKFLLAVHKSVPYEWRPDEIELLKELTARVYNRIERARAEAALRESEALLKKALAIETVGVLFFNLDGRMKGCNQAFERMVGYTRDELLHAVHWKTLTAPEFLEVTRRTAGELAQRGETKPYEKQLIRKDGSRWWGLFAPTKLTGEGTQTDCMEFIIDITERKRAEEALRESEERFRALADNIPQLAWMTEADGWIFWYNKRWFEYTGTTLEQMQGWGWHSVHHPNHVERVTGKFKQALAAGKPWEDTFPLRGKDGNYRWFLSRAFPIKDEHGNVVRWFGSNTDITELRDAEAALAEREAVLRTVTNEARVGLVMVNKERRYLFANQTYGEILGLDERQIVGELVSEVLKDIYFEIGPRLDRAFAGERISYELHLPHHPKTGDERFYEVIYEPRVENVTEPYVVVVMVDITERKRMQQTLERLVAERTAPLQETIAELEGVSYSLSHDMRAPLRTIQSFSEIVLTEAGEKLGPEEIGLMKKIISAANRLDRLIQEVLTYSRVSREALELRQLDVEKLIHQIIDERPELQLPKTKIEIQSPLPMVRGHEAYLTQCITNLLDNAVKFVPPGKTPEIFIWSENAGNKVRLWFEDNGIGIPQESQARVFGIFQRLHDQKSYPGTGIGLAIVRKAVERMGGAAGVQSEPGQGSRFWLELPKGQ